MALPEINLEDYNYELPEDRIAQHPLKERDASKLLVYQNQTIEHKCFKEIVDFLPKDATLVFNDTRVIPARLLFRKDTGATIEIFLLHPELPTTDVNLAILTRSPCRWSCMIGNLKRWKPGQPLHMNLQIGEIQVKLNAVLVSDKLVELQWDPPDFQFVDIIKNAGQVPLPPYMKRKSERKDRNRYQTVYSRAHGAVAAPTAGLHFTKSVLESIESQGVTKEYLTLHVGAGTFQPIKTGSVIDHPMHGEQISVSFQNINNLLKRKSLIAVGTTTLRILESLYWYGVKLINKLGTEFRIEKLAPYQDYDHLPDFYHSLISVKAFMEINRLKTLKGYTEIFIFPPYQVKSCVGLLTNFHLPHSTLILLVAAFVGKDWRFIYHEALTNNYRFLSYGDTSLLLPAIHV